MDRREQYKLLCMVMSMAAGVAYSFGMFTERSPTFESSSRDDTITAQDMNKVDKIEIQFPPATRPAATVELDVLHSASGNCDCESS